MSIQINTPPEPNRSERRLPPDYTSRSFKLRLLMLMGSLILVLVMMKEARKPENWEWMGFKQKKEAAKGQLETMPPGFDNDADPNTTVGNESQTDSAQSKLHSTTEIKTSSGAKTNQAAYPVQARIFWERLLARLGVERRAKLFQLMRLARTAGEADEETRKSLGSLVKIVEQQRNRFETELLDTLSYLEDTSQKENLNQQLFKAKEIWRNDILPAWNSIVAGEEITLNQLGAIERLQVVFDDFSFALVEDGASLNRSAEGPASLRVWERALSLRSNQAKPVTQIQLSGQPAEFRGKAVTIGGWIRRGVRKDFRENELGLSHAYVLWVRPEDSNATPFCIYSQEVPEGFPSIGTDMVSMNERIEASGVFYKIRSYVAESETVLACPLIYCKTFQWRPNEVSAVDDGGWKPNSLTLIVFLVGMPIIATIIAVSVYRSSRLRPYQPGENSQARIERSLDRLKENKEVQTDLERVRQLADQEDPE